jgi:phage shock protein PspC (stress-responsive transcriptional regulator)
MAGKKLYRSKEDRMLLGVCGGIAEYMRVDSTLVRVIAALLLLSGTWSVVLYLILGIVIPENPSQKKTKSKIKLGNNSLVIGFGLVFVGVILLLNNFNLLDWNQIWPILLIVVGVFLLWQNQRKK